jgi:hypothetical protein
VPAPTGYHTAPNPTARFQLDASCAAATFSQRLLRAGGVSAREMPLLVDLMVAVFTRQYSLSIAWPLPSDLHSCASKSDSISIYIALLYKTLLISPNLFRTVLAVRPSASATPLIFRSYKTSGPALYAIVRRNQIQILFTKQIEGVPIALGIQRPTSASVTTNDTHRGRSGLPSAPCFWSLSLIGELNETKVLPRNTHNGRRLEGAWACPVYIHIRLCTVCLCNVK